MKYKNAAIVCAAAGCLFILLAVVCGGAVRWCAMAAALVCLGYLAVQYAHCAADMDALRRQSGEKMLHPLGRELADALEKREISQREAYTGSGIQQPIKNQRAAKPNQPAFFVQHAGMYPQ